MNAERKPNVDDLKTEIPLEEGILQCISTVFNRADSFTNNLVDERGVSEKNVWGLVSSMAEGGRMERSSESEEDDWVPRRCYQFSRRRKRGHRKNKRIAEGRSHEFIYSTKERHIGSGHWRGKNTDKFTAKSCDNIFSHPFRCKGGVAEENIPSCRKAGRRETHYIWRPSTRSEEHLPRLAVHPRSSQIPKTNREQRFTWSLPSLLSGGGKSGALVGLLGKLGNKRRRPTSPTPKGNFGRSFAPTPWILVEFTETSDLPAGESGNDSDHSFEAAVAEIEERKLENQPASVCEGGETGISPCSSELNSVGKKQSVQKQMKSESVARHSLAPEEGSKSCGLRLSVASRPFTLGIRGRLAIPSDQKDCEESTLKVPGVEEGAMLPTRNVPRMPSLESIGSCSLDADVTASECSEAVGITASQRTLHSISFVDFSPLRATEDSGVTGPCESTEKTNESQQSPRSSSPSAVTSPRPPSYVSLSCSISGYSPLSAYDSELRKGFRSGRDVNQVSDTGAVVTKPALTLSDQENHTQKETSGVSSLKSSRGSICSPVHRKPCAGEVAMNGSLQEKVETNGRSSEAEVCFRTGQQESTVGTVRVVQYSQNKSYVRTVTRTFDSASFHGSSSEERPPSPTYLSPSKSFVQQRVERLYGPGALAQGFFRRTSHRGLTSSKINDFSESNDDHKPPRSCASLPVMRHLRPEFRDQLHVRGISPKVPPVVTIIPITVEGSEDPPVKEKDAGLNDNCENNIASAAGLKEVIVTAPPDLCPAAPEVVLPLVPSEEAGSGENGTATISSLPHTDGEVRDGHYFIRLLKAEIVRITKLVESAEKELNEIEEGKVAVPEEAAGWLRSAAGQARLLMRQKMQQFEGLCHKHLSQSPGEAFPTTLEDLAGFWDMVLLQVDSVDTMFQDIDRLRASGWVETPKKSATTKETRPESNINNNEAVAETEMSKKRMVARKGVSAAPSGGKPSGAAKARDEARRKMMEERRRAMRERQKGNAVEGNSEVEIYVPENK